MLSRAYVTKEQERVIKPNSPSDQTRRRRFDDIDLKNTVSYSSMLET
jgi:hypothetical protein